MSPAGEAARLTDVDQGPVGGAPSRACACLHQAATCCQRCSCRGLGVLHGVARALFPPAPAAPAASFPSS